MKIPVYIQGEEILLTDKEFLFANYYLGEARFNATEAAKLAGYSENTARQIGYENLTKPYIQDYINKKTSVIFEKLGITQEMIIQEMAKIAFVNLGDCLHSNWELKELNSITPETIAAIKTIKVDESGFQIVLQDKLSALSKLYDLLNTFDIKKPADFEKEI